MATFGNKIEMFITRYKVKGTELAAYLHVDPSMPTKWKKGIRTVEKRSAMALQIADFMIKTILDEGDDEALGMHEHETTRRRVAQWLFDGSDTSEIPMKVQADSPGPGPGDPPPSAGFAYYGIDGIYEALRLMSRRMPDKGVPITVYISSEYSMLLSDPAAAGIWEYLYTISGRPVRVVFEQWKDAGRVHKITQYLMPFLQSAKIELSYIMSSERYLCYNISFYAQDLCMVMTTETAGAVSSCVSLFLDAKSFVLPMGKVLGKLSDRATPMLACWPSEKNRGAEETPFYDDMYTAFGDLDVKHLGLSLLHCTPASYKKLLAQNGVPADTVRFRVPRFEKMKDDYEGLLSRCRCREIYRLGAVDSALETRRIKTTDLYFTGKYEFKVSDDVLSDILTGMMDALDRFERIQVILSRDEKDDAGSSWRIKEDRCFLLHSAQNGDMQSIYSDNWLLCSQYMTAYDERFRKMKNAVRGKENVMRAIDTRLQKLGRA